MIATATAFAAALILGVVARRLGVLFGATDDPDGTALKPHPHPTSWLGGGAVVGGIAIGLVVEGWPLSSPAAIAIDGAFMLGLADDALDVPPLPRLVAQLGVDLVVAGGGLAVDALPTAVVAWIAAAVLYAAALNAVNMVDGMDGLAGIAAVITALGLALIAARAGHDGSMAVALVTAGAVAGFLVHNLPPARLYLGDNGAYAVAASLAVVVLSQSRTVAGLVGAVTCLGLFLLDLLLAVLRRIVGRRRVTAGDRGHLYDQLQGWGLAPHPTLAVCGIVHLAFVAVGVRAAGTKTSVALATVVAAWVVATVWLVRSGLVSGGGEGPGAARGNRGAKA